MFDDDSEVPPVEKVGYRKPPKRTRFKPGESGNPKGRPKGRESLPAMISRIFTAKVAIREGNKVRRVQQVEAILLSLALRAMKGDPKACITVLALAKEYGHLDIEDVYEFTLKIPTAQPSPFQRRLPRIFDEKSC